MQESSSGPPNPRQARYRRLEVHGYDYPVTIALIAICLIVAAMSRLGSNNDPVSSLYFSAQPSQERIDNIQQRMDFLAEKDQYDTPEYQKLQEQYMQARSPVSQPLDNIQKGEVWRLFTPMFLHFGPIHLIFNLMWVWTLGRALESMLRRYKFILLVLAVAVASNTAQALMKGTNFGGMSGVVYGLFGFIVVHNKLHPTHGIQINPSTIRYMLIWLVLCFTGLLGPIANWAHSIGLVSGGAIGAVYALRTGGLQALRRRHEFRRAINSSSNAIHHCIVCNKTEHDDRDLEFRVGSDGNEYCEHHLPE